MNMHLVSKQLVYRKLAFADSLLTDKFSITACQQAADLLALHFSLNQFQPGSRPGQSCLSSVLLWGEGGNPPSYWHTGGRDLHTYLDTYTQHTGLLGPPSSWSFIVVYVVEGSVSILAS